MSFFKKMFKTVFPEQVRASSEIVKTAAGQTGQDDSAKLAAQQLEAAINSATESGVLPPVTNPPKLEDVDKRETYSSPKYEPLLEAMTAPLTLTKASAPTDQPSSASVKWVETLFADFEHYAAISNQAIGSSEAVTVSRPEYEYEPAAYDSYRSTKHLSSFKGHFGTSKWTMLLKGAIDKVQIYLIPSESLLRFSANRSFSNDFTPVMIVQTDTKNGVIEWHTGNQNITLDTLSTFTRAIFDDFIQVVTGKISETDLRANYSIEPVREKPRVEDSIKNSAPVQSLDQNLLTDLKEELDTWSQCRALLATISKDMLLIDDKMTEAHSLSDQESIKELEALSKDLRLFSAEASKLLVRYTKSS